MNTMQWDSESDCRDDCDLWAIVPYQVDALGDNIACRTDHLMKAGDNPLQECQHINESELCNDPIGGMGGIGGLGGGGIGGVAGGGGLLVGGGGTGG